MDYVDEILEDYFAGAIQLEELENDEVIAVLERVKAMAAVKVLDGFEESCRGKLVHLPSTLTVH